MIRRENINFVASLYAPNPKEVSYWIDLTESPDGQIIKTFVNNEWIKVNEDKNDEQGEDITQLRQDVNTLTTTKADKATTLSGYGITDAYTKTEVDGKINSKANNSDVYTKAETEDQIDIKVAALVSQAPETLDTLNELAAALGDDPNFATTITNQIAGKANAAHTHTIADVTNLQTTLNNKANASHTHTASQITDLDLSSYITGQGVSRIEAVTELPETPEENVLYLVIAQTAPA